MPECGNFGSIRDDFADDATDPRWHAWNANGGSVAETGSQVTVTLPPGFPDARAGYTTRYAYDLTGSAFSAKVVQIEGGSATLAVGGEDLDGAPSAQLVASGGTLYARVVDESGPHDRASVPFDLAAQRYWRIREAAAELHWETSADTLTWTPLHGEPLPFAVGDVYGTIGARGTVPIQTTIGFDDVDIDHPPVPLCAAASEHERFDGDTRDRRWKERRLGDCAIDETAGTLRIALDSSGGDECGIESRHLFDLRGSALTVELVETPAEANDFYAYLQVTAPGLDTTYLQLTRRALLWIEQQVGDSDEDSIVMDDPIPRFWRIAADGTQAVFATSTDGVAWTTAGTLDLGWDVSQVVLAVGAGSTGSSCPCTVDVATIDP